MSNEDIDTSEYDDEYYKELDGLLDGLDLKECAFLPNSSSTSSSESDEEDESHYQDVSKNDEEELESLASEETFENSPHPSNTNQICQKEGLDSLASEETFENSLYPNNTSQENNFNKEAYLYGDLDDERPLEEEDNTLQNEGRSGEIEIVHLPPANHNKEDQSKSNIFNEVTGGGNELNNLPNEDKNEEEELESLASEESFENSPHPSNTYPICQKEGLDSLASEETFENSLYPNNTSQEDNFNKEAYVYGDLDEERPLEEEDNTLQNEGRSGEIEIVHLPPANHNKEDQSKNNIFNEVTGGGNELNNLPNEDKNEVNKPIDPERDELLAVLEGNGEPEISVEDMLKKLHEEKKNEEKESDENSNSVSSKVTSSNSKVATVNIPILHPNVDALIDLTDEQRVVTIKVEPAEKVIVIDDDPCEKEEKEYIRDKTATKGIETKNSDHHRDTETPSSSTGPYRQQKVHKKNEEEKIDENSNSVSSKVTSSNSKVATVNTPILHPNVDALIDLTDEQRVVTIKVEPEMPIIIKDEPEIINIEATNKPVPSTSRSGMGQGGKKDKPIIIDCDPIIIKIEDSNEPAPSTSRTGAESHNKEKNADPGKETEEGEVVDDDDDDDDDDESTVKNIAIGQGTLTLINPSLSMGSAALYGVGNHPDIHPLYSVMLSDYQNFSKLALKSIGQLTKYVSKHKHKKKSHKKNHKKKSTTKRLSSTSKSRSRSETPTKKLNTKSVLEKSYHSQKYSSSSPSPSPQRRNQSHTKKNYLSTKGSRLRSRSLSKSPPRKRYRSNRSRSHSRSSSPSRKSSQVVKKDFGKRSPSASLKRRKRRRSSSSSSSSSSSYKSRNYATDSTSSSSSPRRRHIHSSSSRRKSRFRSRTPKRSPTIHLSKKIASTSTTSMVNMPSTSQQSFVAQQTYQQEVRQGSDVMTRKAVVTTSFKEELQSFKNAINQTVFSTSSARNFEDLDVLEISVFDQGGKDVTIKRPDGDLNHPFFIHPEDAELYRIRCQNGLQPLQALHEICIKSGWKLPNYLLLPTPKGFRFGMEINGHRFVTEKTAQQKKLAKAEAALVVLKWMKIVC